MQSNYKMVALELLEPSKFNPRKKSEVDESFVNSIKQKGVIEPIIVRPLKGHDGRFEIVAGERRFLGAEAAKLKAIPAIVRDLGDDEAYDFILIENLQREDLTALEEAESFKAYVGRRGKDSIKELAEKTSISPRYIRVRIDALGLPKPALAAWEKGEVSFGHLEQLLRLPGPTDVVQKLNQVKSNRTSVAELRHEINNMAVLLSMARFDVEKGCQSCRQNSAVQRELFGIGEEKTICTNPKCFKAKQAEWFRDHWPESAESKRYKTRGARFDHDVNWNVKHVFYHQENIAKKCLECDSFVSLVKTDGTIQDPYSDATACVGDAKCFNSAEQAGKREQRIAAGEKNAAAVDAGKGGRVSWHGAYFRNQFFRKRIPEILAGLKPDDERVKTLMVICLAHENSKADEALRKALGIKGQGYHLYADTFRKLLALPYKEVAPILPRMVEAVLLQGQDANEYCMFGTGERRLAAEFLGVDLAKEWAASEEYLNKKTRRELLAFGKKSGIFKLVGVKLWIEKALGGKSADPERLKKSELVDAFLKSGVDLVGKVPAEILKG